MVKIIHISHYIVFSSRNKLYFNCRICELDIDEEEVVWTTPDTSQCSIVSYDTKGTIHTTVKARVKAKKIKEKF